VGTVRNVRGNRLQVMGAEGVAPTVGAEVRLLETREKGTVLGAGGGWFRVRVDGV
jgi:hypothetical protein